MKRIFEKIETDFEYITNFKLIGILKSIALTFSSRLAEFRDKLKFIEKQAFIKTADKEYLHLHAGSLLPYKTAKKSTGIVKIFSNENLIITKGTILISDQVEYEVIEQVITKPVETEIKVRCMRTGNDTNRNFGDEISFKIITSGVNKNASVIFIEGGKNDESTEEYRSRVEYYMQNVQAPFNDNNIKSVIFDNFPLINNVWIKGGDYQLGKVHVFILDVLNDATSEDIDIVKNQLLSIKPPSMRDSDLIVLKPELNHISVNILNILPFNSELNNQITIRVKNLFEQKKFEQNILIKDIEAIINTVNINGLHVQQFTLDNTDIIKIDNTAIILDSVNIS